MDLSMPELNGLDLQNHLAIYGHARAREKLKNSKANYWRSGLMKGWTQARKARQASLIQRWKPWGALNKGMPT
jgi:hypothetical protein